MDVSAWLEALGLDEYAEAFAANDIDAETLRKLTAEDLGELGVGSVGHRRRLLAAIADLDASERLASPLVRGATMQPPVGERRQVTVLFADLSGFTKLSSELGAEETHVLLNRYFDTVDRIIEGYGGTIDKHIGDNVMAVFGAPVAHTDDPERAVRAAFDIHGAMAGLSMATGQRLLTHIGIASGQVVASVTGSDRHTEYTVTGDTVNLASRLDDMARPRETLISDAVQRATSRIANYALRGEVRISGLQQTVRVWAALELVPGPFAEVQSTFVGRRAELAQFRALLDETSARGKGHSILVRGEPGIGKTRLVEEFGKIATASGFQLHRSQVFDFGAGKGQEAIPTLVRSLLAIASDSDEDTRGAAVDRALAREKEALEDTRIFLNDLLDLPQPPKLRDLYYAMDVTARNAGMRETVSRLVAARAGNAPLLIVVEDIHWADQLTFDRVIAITSAVVDQPALLVATTRIEGKTLQQKWLASLRGSPFTTMELQPLRADEALKLAKDLFGEDTANLEVCVERADGNPLFLEQLARATVDRKSELPDTLQGLVLARMDRLGKRDRLALQAASVLGQRYSLDTLQYLLSDETYVCTTLMEHQTLAYMTDLRAAVADC